MSAAAISVYRSLIRASRVAFEGDKEAFLGMLYRYERFDNIQHQLQKSDPNLKRIGK
jgi:hypothetical protein